MTTTSTIVPVRHKSAAGTEHKVYMHSTLLYWWPVWFVALVMALWIRLDNHHMVVVPEGTTVTDNQVTAPDGVALEQPGVHMARSKFPGFAFVVTLLLVICFSTGWMRSWKAYTFAALVIALLIFISWWDWWEPLYRGLRRLPIYLSLGAYLTTGVMLLLIWLWYLLVIDRRTYAVFSTSQVRIHDEIGEAEKVFDTSFVAFEKKPDDWFRRLVGLGAGDLVLIIGGASPQVIELPNVVAVRRRMRLIAQLLRTRDVE